MKRYWRRRSASRGTQHLLFGYQSLAIQVQENPPRRAVSVLQRGLQNCGKQIIRDDPYFSEISWPALVLAHHARDQSTASSFRSKPLLMRDTLMTIRQQVALLQLTISAKRE